MRFLTRSYLIQIIHKHLTHFVDRNGGIDGAVQTQFPHSVRQGSQVDGVGVGEEHSINLMNVTAWGGGNRTHTLV